MSPTFFLGVPTLSNVVLALEPLFVHCIIIIIGALFATIFLSVACCDFSATSVSTLRHFDAVDAQNLILLDYLTD